MTTKRSTVYQAASMGAEAALPPVSKALIAAHDELHRAWGNAGWPTPVPPELSAASERVHADALASIAMELRARATNEALAEWRAERNAA